MAYFYKIFDSDSKRVVYLCSSGGYTKKTVDGVKKFVQKIMLDVQNSYPNRVLISFLTLAKNFPTTYKNFSSKHSIG